MILQVIMPLMRVANALVSAVFALFLYTVSTVAQEPPWTLQTGEPIDGFTNPVFFGGKAAFLTGIKDGYTPTVVAETDGASLHQVATFATPHPGDPSQFLTAFYNLAGGQDFLYFTGNSNRAFNGSYGLFRYDGNEIIALVPDASALPPENGFTGLAGLKAGGGKAVFSVRQGQTYEAYYLHDGEQLTLIADSNTTVDEGSGGLLELPTVGAGISANGEHIIIRVKTALAPAVGKPDEFTIYRFVGGGLQAVAQIGDDIGNGFSISNITSQPIVLNDGSILLNVHTVPAGQALVHIAPDNARSILELPDLGEGNMASLSGVSAGADDGVYIYGQLMVYGPTYNILEKKAVRYTADGAFQDLFSIPFEADGDNWGESHFQFVAATEEGYLAIARNPDGEERVFTNIEALASSTGSTPRGSPWIDYESVEGWKGSLSIGWIFDGEFPYVYSDTLQSWTYISGSSLEGFHLYNFQDQSWYWVVESFNGWAYRYSGGTVDPGWVLFK